MQEWNYTSVPGIGHEPDDDSRGWSPGSCLLVLLMVLAFWLVVIGGGLWLGDNLTDILEGIRE